MLIEAVDHPITYRWPNGKIVLVLGQPVDVSAERGAKILKKCGSKVRAVPQFVVGGWVEFNSPVFGPCTGQFVMAEGENLLVDHHSETGDERWIKVKWITRTLEGV